MQHTPKFSVQSMIYCLFIINEEIQPFKYINMKIVNTPIVIILMGNIGTGKSTIAKRLANKINAHIIAGDDLIINNECKKENTYGTIIQKMEHLMYLQMNIIIDGKFLTDESRDPLLVRAEINSYNSLVIDCGKGNCNNLIRRQKESNDYSPEVWKNEFEANKLKYQKPTVRFKKQRIIEKSGISHFNFMIRNH